MRETLKILFGDIRSVPNYQRFVTNHSIPYCVNPKAIYRAYLMNLFLKNSYSLLNINAK